MSDRMLGTRTVLFTDYVDSTALRSRLGDRAAERVFGALERLQRRSVESARGSLVKHTGDGFLFTFLSANDALVGAARLLREIRRRELPEGAAVGVRLGMSAGDVQIGEDGDVFGLPVVEAARLCGVAESEQCFVSDVVRLLAGSWDEHAFDSVGELELKGLDGALTVWRLAVDLRSGVWDFPADGLVDEWLAVVGRADVLRETSAWADQALAGGSGAIFLVGDAGAGKTRVAVEIARRFHEKGGLVLVGRCDQHLVASLQPFGQALKWWSSAGGDISSDAAPFVPELARQFPALGLTADPAERADADSERYRLFEGVVAALSGAAATATTVLLIDDLHWAEESTRLCLIHLLKAAVPGLLVVATARDIGSDPGALLAGAGRLPGVRRVEVAALTEGDAEELADAAGVDWAQLSDAHRRTGGNAFFLTETIRSGGGTSETLVEAIRQRISAAGSEVEDLLEGAAVLGTRWTPEEVQAVVDLDDPFEAAQQALREQLISETADVVGEFEFSHALIREAVLASQSATRTARLHARAFESASHPVELARHGIAAQRFVPPGQAVAAVLSAVDSLGGSDAGLTSSLVDTALDARSDIPEEHRLELHLFAAQALASSNGHEAVRHAKAATSLARASGANQALVDAAIVLGRIGPWVIQRDREPVELVEAALELAGDEADRALLWAGSASLGATVRPIEWRSDRVGRALDLAAAIGGKTLEDVLDMASKAVESPLAVDTMEQIDRQLLSVGRPDRSIYRAWWAGDTPRLKEWQQQLASDPRSTPADRVSAQWCAGTLALIDARLDEADEIRHTGFENARLVMGDTAIGVNAWQSLIGAWLRHDLARARGDVEQLLDQIGGPLARLALAWIEAGTGHPDEAHRQLDHIRPDRLSGFHHSRIGTVGIACLAMTASELGDPAWLERAHELALPHAHRMCGIEFAGFPSGAHLLGRIAQATGHREEADQWYRTAAAAHQHALAFAFITQADHDRTKSLPKSQ